MIDATPRFPANLRELLISMLQEDRNMRTRTVREVLERLTLRKIVALGIAATEHAETEEQPIPMPLRVEDPAISVASDRRKARLRSLLDDL